MEFNFFIWACITADALNVGGSNKLEGQKVC